MIVRIINFARDVPYPQCIITMKISLCAVKIGGRHCVVNRAFFTRCESSGANENLAKNADSRKLRLTRAAAAAGICSFNCLLALSDLLHQSLGHCVFVMENI